MFYPIVLSLVGLFGTWTSAGFIAELNKLRGTEKLCDTPRLVDRMDGISLSGDPPFLGLEELESPPLDGAPII